MTDNGEIPHSGERESGTGNVEAREKYSMERMFDPQFSRPEPTGGRWWQIGPFGMAGDGRPKGHTINRAGWKSRRSEE